jgi:hypothetical protein
VFKTTADRAEAAARALREALHSGDRFFIAGEENALPAIYSSRITADSLDSFCRSRRGTRSPIRGGAAATSTHVSSRSGGSRSFF